jgi:putative hydrolase of the HAD superfamily
MKYKAVIFDLFGTLVDNFKRRDYDVMLADISGTLKAPVTDFARLWRDSFNDRVIGALKDQRESFTTICRELEIKTTPQQIERAVEIRMAFARRTTIPRDGAVALLAELRRSGLKTGLISDCTGEIPLIWNETPFRNLFDATIFSCSVKTKKPDPIIYRMAVDQLKVKPEECLYVGDGSSNELTGAGKVGMNPVRIRAPYDIDEEQFMEREDGWAGLKISNLKEVLDLVKD